MYYPLWSRRRHGSTVDGASAPKHIPTPGLAPAVVTRAEIDSVRGASQSQDPGRVRAQLVSCASTPVEVRKLVENVASQTDAVSNDGLGMCRVATLPPSLLKGCGAAWRINPLSLASHPESEVEGGPIYWTHLVTSSGAHIADAGSTGSSVGCAVNLTHQSQPSSWGAPCRINPVGYITNVEGMPNQRVIYHLSCMSATRATPMLSDTALNAPDHVSMLLHLTYKAVMAGPPLDVTYDHGGDSIISSQLGLSGVRTGFDLAPNHYHALPACDDRTTSRVLHSDVLPSQRSASFSVCS